MTAARLRRLALPLFALTWGTGPIHADDAAFAYLTRDGETLQTMHTLSYRFSAAAPFVTHGPSHRSARFNDVPFDISLSAFIHEDSAIMVHAEHVADGSGASNYDRFPVTDWPVAGFRGEGPKCHDIPASIVAEEHDLLWLRDRGFEPSGPIWIEQHFLSGNAYNDEIVVSLIARGLTCEQEAEARASLALLRTALEVSPTVN